MTPNRPRLVGGQKVSFTILAGYYKIGLKNSLQALRHDTRFRFPSVIQEYE